MGTVVIGVDPHKRINVVCVVDGLGRVVAGEQFDNSAAGFRELKVFWPRWRQRQLGGRGGQRGGQVPGPAPRRGRRDRRLRIFGY